MDLVFCSFSSGSSGNCYMIRSDETAVLVDVGISKKKIVEGFEATGTDMDMLRGILITHEHSDHVRSLGTITKNNSQAFIYATRPTWQCIEDKVPTEQRVSFEMGEGFFVGDIEVKSFGISHDAVEPVGYSLRVRDKKICIVTDTGYVTEEIYEEIRNADLLAIEANHDVNVIQFCKYPYYIKRRILGDRGHLSNDAAAECLCKLLTDARWTESEKNKYILLSHLSKENNTPEIAHATVRNLMQERGIIVGSNLIIDVIRRDEIGKMYKL